MVETPASKVPGVVKAAIDFGFSGVEHETDSLSGDRGSSSYLQVISRKLLRRPSKATMEKTGFSPGVSADSSGPLTSSGSMAPPLPPWKMLKVEGAARVAAAPARVVPGDRPTAHAVEINSSDSGDRSSPVVISSEEAVDRPSVKSIVDVFDRRSTKSSEGCSLDRLRVLALKKKRSLDLEKKALDLEIQVLEMEEKLSQSGRRSGGASASGEVQPREFHVPQVAMTARESAEFNVARLHKSLEKVEEHEPMGDHGFTSGGEGSGRPEIFITQVNVQNNQHVELNNHVVHESVVEGLLAETLQARTETVHAAFVAEHAEHRLADAEAQAEAVIGQMRVRAESFVAELEGTHSHRVAALERVAEDRAVDLERMQQMMLNMRLEVEAERQRVHSEVAVALAQAFASGAQSVRPTEATSACGIPQEIYMGSPCCSSSSAKSAFSEVPGYEELGRTVTVAPTTVMAHAPSAGSASKPPDGRGPPSGPGGGPPSGSNPGGAGGSGRPPPTGGAGGWWPLGGGPPGDEPPDSPGGSAGGSPPPSVKSGLSAATVAGLMASLNRRKYKDTDEVRVPQLPTANQFRAWKSSVYHAVNACSGRPDDKAVAWMLETAREGAVQEDFRDPGPRFATVDRKLATALQKVATGELGRVITQESDKCSEKRSRTEGSRDLLSCAAMVRNRKNRRALVQFARLASDQNCQRQSPGVPKYLGDGAVWHAVHA